DGIIGPPYEFCYLDLAGDRRWQVVHGPLVQALDEQGRHRQRRRRPSTVAATAISFEAFARDWLANRRVRTRTHDRYRRALEQRPSNRSRPAARSASSTSPRPYTKTCRRSCASAAAKTTRTLSSSRPRTAPGLSAKSAVKPSRAPPQPPTCASPTPTSTTCVT